MKAYDLREAEKKVTLSEITHPGRAAMSTGSGRRGTSNERRYGSLTLLCLGNNVLAVMNSFSVWCVCGVVCV